MLQEHSHSHSPTWIRQKLARAKRLVAFFLTAGFRGIGLAWLSRYNLPMGHGTEFMEKYGESKL